MRRSQTNNYGTPYNPYAAQQYGNGSQAQQSAHKDQNEELEDDLHKKVHALKSLSIDIGQEVRYQNSMLNDMDTTFENTGSLLGRAMEKVKLLSKGGHNWYIFYLFLFALFVFFVLWVVIRF